MDISSESGPRAALGALSGVDAVGVDNRVAKLGSRSLKVSTQSVAIDLIISMIDLTTLEGYDTPARIRSLCARAAHPDSTDRTIGPVAAVCVYPDMIPSAKEALMGSGILLAAVAGAFPSGRSSLAIKLSEVEWALSLGADEIDMVIDRGAFLAGHLGQVYDEIVAIKSVCGKRRLKVILETGELITYDNIKRASWLALLAGADFIKTSTGKAVINATPGAALVMLEAVRDFTEQSGNRVGVKVAGGIRSTRDATRYLVIVDETVGSAWMTPEYFRFGASSLLTDLVMQRHHLATGIYLRLDNFSLD